MLSAMRKRFTYTNVAVTLALVFAMSGGAYAASRYVITSTKQIKPSVLKSLAGKTGPAGPAGPAGVAGSTGPPGPQGPAGSAGANGSPGESVTSAAVGKGANCKEGGAKFTVGSGASAYACNGEKGKQGEPGEPGAPGEPWAVGGLPAGATETGVWSAGAPETATGLPVLTPLSFPVPLAARLDEAHVHFMEVGAASTEECPGTVEEPKAASGNLCVYAELTEGMASGRVITPGFAAFFTKNEVGALKSGAELIVVTNGEATRHLEDGSWAVTG
jgi:hypothetical protein